MVFVYPPEPLGIGELLHWTIEGLEDIMILSKGV